MLIKIMNKRGQAGWNALIGKGLIYYGLLAIVCFISFLVAVIVGIFWLRLHKFWLLYLCLIAIVILIATFIPLFPLIKGLFK